MRIRAEESAALIVDIQERLMPVIHEQDAVVKRCVVLIRGLKALGVPFVVPRQYPKGLGDVLPEIRDAIGEYEPLDKVSFSACYEEDQKQVFQALNKQTIIVCGAEAHVCVLQSVLDLIAGGYRVALVCDCIGSRFPQDKEIALRRAEQEGALLTTAESLLFELAQKAGTDTFKTISRLIK